MSSVGSGPGLDENSGQARINSSGWRPGPKLQAAVAAWLALIGAVLVWAAIARPLAPGSAQVASPPAHHVVGPSLTPTPVGTTAQQHRAGIRDKVAGLVLPESDPVAVSLPRIGVQSGLVDLGLDSNGGL